MRVDVRKTPKLFIDGSFVRSESGRTYRHESDGRAVAIALASRKDVRDAVRAARPGAQAWREKSAYNRGQILYRLAEMIESRRSEFEVSPAEFKAAVDHIVWYAGWCDKIEQYLSTKNAVAGPHFNVSAPEPMGIVAVVAPANSPLLGLVGATIPALCGGNSVVAAASHDYPLQAIALCEAIATCDLTPGAFNLLTGDQTALSQELARHMDVNAISIWSADQPLRSRVETLAAENVKRVDSHPEPTARYWFRDDARTPWRVAEFMEIKTVWHPAGV
jgi:acyl-CoA reductase-like NAD-dependent aldehyde dehydrogenase